VGDADSAEEQAKEKVVKNKNKMSKRFMDVILSSKRMSNYNIKPQGVLGLYVPVILFFVLRLKQSFSLAE
jgi:hypothetical protein